VRTALRCTAGLESRNTAASDPSPSAARSARLVAKLACRAVSVYTDSARRLREGPEAAAAARSQRCPPLPTGSWSRGPGQAAALLKV